MSYELQHLFKAVSTKSGTRRDTGTRGHVGILVTHVPAKLLLFVSTKTWTLGHRDIGTGGKKIKLKKIISEEILVKKCLKFLKV